MAKPFSLITAVDGVRWQCWQHLSGDIARFDAVTACASGQSIKQSSAREVSFVTLAGRDCVLKIFHTPVVWDRLRSRLLSSRAELEWNCMRRLAAIGLPVPEALAVGSKGDSSYLLVARLRDVRSLKEIDWTTIDFTARRRIIYGLADILSTLHNHNVLHQDLHLGNFMLDPAGKLYLLDLHDVRFAHFAGPQVRLRNLAMLGNAVTMHATTADHLVFLRHYIAASTVFADWPWRQCVAMAKKATDAYRIAFWRDRLPRCRQRNKYFGVWRDGHHRHGRYRCDWSPAPAVMDNLLDASHYGRLFKESRSSLVVQTAHGILKQYRQKKRRNMVLDWWRGSRAQRAWAAGFDCLNRGIPTARPLCFIEERHGPLITTSYLLCEEITPAQTLYASLKNFGFAPQGEDFRRKRELLVATGRLLRLLHLRGLLHRDLKSSNFLVSAGRVWLIDLDGMSQQGWFTRTKRRANLQRLLLSLADIPGVTKADLWRVVHGFAPYADSREQRWWIDGLPERDKT